MGDAANVAKVIGRSNATFNVSIHGLKMTVGDPENVSFQWKFKINVYNIGELDSSVFMAHIVLYKYCMTSSYW